MDPNNFMSGRKMGDRIMGQFRARMKKSENFDFILDFFRLCLDCFPIERRHLLAKIVEELENVKELFDEEQVTTEIWIEMLRVLGISDDFKSMNLTLKYSVNCVSPKEPRKRKDTTG